MTPIEIVDAIKAAKTEHHTKLAEYHKHRQDYHAAELVHIAELEKIEHKIHDLKGKLEHATTPSSAL